MTAAAALLSAAQDDPVLAHQVERAQHQAYAALAELVDEATALLSQRLGAAPARPADHPTPAPTSMPMNVLALRTMSRQRQTETQRRRELVEAFVLGALINHDNPAWDPLDPATSRKPQDSALGALLLAAGTNEQ
ncbi:hypothetical protein ACFFTM_08770 [Pseudoduganella plicata]|uniref:Uncharacterized protein n=1 Tax=Pseudoduganella plicata TaxID=321984 RepID=A0A4P7BDQ8_9BURK|nr:hypothetical protein [Pseudoduganella plicata]QBQ35429.1 hypothetical protein E1742_04050 [Pseudoduganella plicata]GGZ01665.1 hypothetical protein GCM10007388_39240 [Pseudoduganella plicata]